MFDLTANNAPLFMLESAVQQYLKALKALEAADPQAAVGNGIPLQGNIAVLPVKGPILYSVPDWIMENGWAVGARQLERNLTAAVADPDIRAVILDIDSPGGSVFGLEELAATMRSLRSQKPIVAMISPMAASAAYYIAASCGEIVMTPSGMVGSVGTVLVLWDFSAELETLGIKVHIIRNPSDKGEGSGLEEITDEFKAHVQGMVDFYSAAFQRDVARGRGVSINHVRNGMSGGRVIQAPEGLSTRMVDRIATMPETLARLAGGRIAQRTRAEYKARSPESEEVLPPITMDQPTEEEFERGAVAPAVAMMVSDIEAAAPEQDPQTPQAGALDADARMRRARAQARG